jgi:purine-nucleoside phosphorylase
MSDYRSTVQNAADFIRDRAGEGFRAALILGSGLGGLTDEMNERFCLPYGNIPGFPTALVPGHRGELVAGRLGGKRVLVFSGRFHLYQGYSPQQVVLPVRVAGLLSIPTLIVTNASGGINDSFKTGDLMLIRDHINCTGVNPLAGPEGALFGTVFIDMSRPYDSALRKKAAEAASRVSMNAALREGVYLATLGPSYETKAEIGFFRSIGADAVGMSTVPEVIAAVQHRIRVLGISVITNLACGIGKGALDHREVLATMEKAGGEVSDLLGELVHGL